MFHLPSGLFSFAGVHHRLVTFRSSCCSDYFDYPVAPRQRCANVWPFAGMRQTWRFGASGDDLQAAASPHFTKHADSHNSASCNWQWEMYNRIFSNLMPVTNITVTDKIYCEDSAGKSLPQVIDLCCSFQVKDHDRHFASGNNIELKLFNNVELTYLKTRARNKWG